MTSKDPWLNVTWESPLQRVAKLSHLLPIIITRYCYHVSDNHHIRALVIIYKKYGAGNILHSLMRKRRPAQAAVQQSRALLVTPDTNHKPPVWSKILKFSMQRYPVVSWTDHYELWCIKDGVILDYSTIVQPETRYFCHNILFDIFNMNARWWQQSSCSSSAFWNMVTTMSAVSRISLYCVPELSIRVRVFLFCTIQYDIKSNYNLWDPNFPRISQGFLARPAGLSLPTPSR